MSCDVKDIVVVGAGLVGAPLACALSAQGWSVVLLDAESVAAEANTASAVNAANTTDAASMAGSISMASVGSCAGNANALPTPVSVNSNNLKQRCTALSLGTQQWFARQGFWSAIGPDATPIEQVIVSHRGYFGVTRLHAAELEVPALGYVIDNRHMGQAMNPLLADSAVEHRSLARVVSVSHYDDHVEVELADGDRVRGRLLLACDGVTSVVRESLGIGTRQLDYQQAAVLTTLRLAGEHAGVAHERFTESGPLALLPRNASHMSVVDCIEPSERTTLAAMDDLAYLQRLQARFGHRLGRFAEVGERLIVPLVRIEASAQSAPRTLLLGNSVRLLHPVGGQGYNLAMRDVDVLLRLLKDIVQRDAHASDPGNSALLSEFVRQRRSDQQQVVRFTDALARSFRGQSAVLGHVRSAALLGLDTLGPLRKGFARRTMGLFS